MAIQYKEQTGNDVQFVLIFSKLCVMFVFRCGFCWSRDFEIVAAASQGCHDAPPQKRS
jgi:hypothetical protein